MAQIEHHPTEYSRSALTLMVFASTLMLVSNVFVFVPFSIYQGNLDEFEVGFLQLLAGHWKTIILIWLVLLSPLFLTKRLVGVYGVLIFVLACFTWLQSTLFMWDYGLIDGREIDFQPFSALGALDLLILIFIILSAFLFTSRIQPLVNTISVIFIITQFGLMLSDAAGRQDFWARTLPPLEIPEALGSISRGQNIFHIILDSAQSDVFLELVDASKLREEFDGFTLFLENAAVAPHTAFAIPTIFSGKLFDGSQSPEKYFRAAVEHGFHKELIDAGYTVNLIPLLPMGKGPYTNYFEIPSGYRGTYKILVRTNTAKLMDTALFKLSPHFLRVKVYNEGNWFLSNMNHTTQNVHSFREKSFFKDYIDNLRVDQDDPAYHFIHLMPPHPPYVTLANGAYAGEVLPDTRENFSNEMRPMVDLIIRLIQRLQYLGVYDSAAIIVQGDHGSSVGIIAGGRNIEPCLPRLPALLAIKTPMNNGALTVSSTMTSIVDIAPTILNFAGQSTTGIFQMDPSTNRQRHYYSYNENRITNYLIDGSVFDPNSCKKVGSRNIKFASNVYEMGSKIEFGMEGETGGIMSYGWGTPLNGYSWSKSKKAALLLRIPEKYLGTDLIMDLEFRPFIDDEKQPKQRISVSVNGVMVSEWVERTQVLQKRRIHIPASAIDRSELSILFEFPDAESPKSLGLGADRRSLGIALQSILLSSAETSE